MFWPDFKDPEDGELENTFGNFNYYNYKVTVTLMGFLCDFIVIALTSLMWSALAEAASEANPRR